MAILTESKINETLSAHLDNPKYRKYLESAENIYYELHKKEMPVNLKSTLAKNLYATESYFSEKGYDVSSYLREATTPSDVGAFIHHAFDIITAILPSTVLEEFVTIQGMDRRVGEIFFFDIVTGSAKGQFTKGGTYISSQIGARPKAGDYSSERVEKEELSGSGLTVTGTLSWTPVKVSVNEPLVIEYVIGSVQKTSTWNGVNIGGDTELTGVTLNAQNGALTLTFSSSASGISVSYCYDSLAYDSANYKGLPEVDVRLTSQLVTAQRRALKTKWLLDTASMLSKEHGKDIEKELLEAVIAGVTNEIQVEIANDLLAKATAGSVTFSNTPPANQIPYVFHRQELLGKVIEADTMIENKVRKVKANFVIGGAMFSNIVKGLPLDIFEPANYEDHPPVGMHVIGKLYNQYKIIQNFDYPVDAFLVGAKGNSWLYTGYVYAPFIPIMTTKPIVDEDLMTWPDRKSVV